MKLAIKVRSKRLLKQYGNESSNLLTANRADEEAIKVFTENLKQLCFGAPYGEKSVMAYWIRDLSGCKLVLLRPYRDNSCTMKLYFHMNAQRFKESADGWNDTVTGLAGKFDVRSQSPSAMHCWRVRQKLLSGKLGLPKVYHYHHG